MSKFSNYLETQIANYHKGTNMPAAPTVYLGLNNGDPGEAGTGGTEVSATISARQAITFGSIATNGSNREIKNSATIDFGTAGGACTVDAFKICDASTGGNVLVYNTTTSKSVNASDPVEVAADGLAVQVGGTAQNHLRDIILNWMKGTTAAAAPTLYVRLWDGDPTGAGTDVTDNIRAAGGVAITFGTVTDGAFSNSAAIDFGNADAAEDVTHFTVEDAANGTGNMWHAAALTTSRNINAADPVQFDAGALTVTIA